MNLGVRILLRLTRAVLLFASVAAVCFLLARAAPGSFFDDLALRPEISAASVQSLKERYATTEPFVKQFPRWLAAAARGDLGVSLANGIPVSHLVSQQAAQTLRLTLLSSLLTWGIGLPLAILCATQKLIWLDRFSSLLASILLSLPELLVALGVLYFGARFRLLPTVGSILPPTIVLVSVSFPVVFRHARAALRDAAESSFVLAARAHKISSLRLWLLYILPAAANPLISLLGLTIGGLASASLLAEAVLSRPGLGSLYLEAVSSRDVDVVVAVLLLSAAFLVAGNLVADVLLLLCDPRIASSSPEKVRA